MHAYDLILCAKLEDDLKMKLECSVEVCSRRGLKVNANEGLECEIYVDGA